MFITINRIMTHVWSAIFFVCIVISLYPSLFTRAVIPLAIIIGFGIPFNIRFPDYYLRRLGLPSIREQREMATQEEPAREQPANMPLPSSAFEAISLMPTVFNAEAAGDMKAVIAFIVTGDEEFTGYIAIENGRCVYESQPPGNPDLAIQTPAHVWLGIARKEIDGQQAYMRQDYKAEGNLGILLRLNRIFSGSDKSGTERNGKAVKVPAKLREHRAESGKNVDLSSTLQKENAMKVLAINSSPRGHDQSRTHLILSHLVSGMREAGAEVEVVELRKKKVNYCIGCFTCWTKTPGICLHKDDMTNELFPKLLESDLVVYATPLYHYTVNASLKTFIERTLPILEPFFILEKGVTRHPLRHTHPPVAVLSVAGFPEMSVFDQLSKYVNFLFRDGLVAEIYRPGAESMGRDGHKAAEIYDALSQAGRELVESMEIAPTTMERITKPVIDFKTSASLGNLFWKTCIAEGVTPKEFTEKKLVPRPDSIETFLMIMPMGFNSKKAGDTKAVIQFDFSGEVDGSCYFDINQGKIGTNTGPAQNPDLTIQAPFDVWMDIMTRKADWTNDVHAKEIYGRRRFVDLDENESTIWIGLMRFQILNQCIVCEFSG